MKRTRTSSKGYSDWRQREGRMLVWSLAVGAVAAGIAAVLIYFGNRGH
jgi:hypothetical protein